MMSNSWLLRYLRPPFWPNKRVEKNLRKIGCQMWMLWEKQSSQEEEQSPDVYRSRLFLLSCTGEFLLQFIDDIVKFMIAEIVWPNERVEKNLRQIGWQIWMLWEKRSLRDEEQSPDVYRNRLSSLSHRRVSTSCDITSKFGNRSTRFQAVQEGR